MKTNALILFFSFCLIVFAKAQTASDTGKVYFIQNAKITTLMQTAIHTNKKVTINGYRVKIHLGADKTVANNIKATFLAKYSNVPAYTIYDQPNFNVSVGNFRTKLEAYKFFKTIQEDFPAAFIVEDNI